MAIHLPIGSLKTRSGLELPRANRVPTSPLADDITTAPSGPVIMRLDHVSLYTSPIYQPVHKGAYHQIKSHKWPCNITAPNLWNKSHKMAVDLLISVITGSILAPKICHAYFYHFPPTYHGILYTITICTKNMSCLFLSLPTYISWYLVHNHYLKSNHLECIGHIKQHFITNNPSHMSPTTFESQKKKNNNHIFKIKNFCRL